MAHDWKDDPDDAACSIRVQTCSRCGASRMVPYRGAALRGYFDESWDCEAVLVSEVMES